MRKRREIQELEVTSGDCAEALFLLEHGCRLVSVELERTGELGRQECRFRFTGMNAQLWKLQWWGGSEKVDVHRMSTLFEAAAALSVENKAGHA